MRADSNSLRLAEVARYDALYRDPGYALGQRRRQHITQSLSRVIPKGNLLDVSTGRGEVLEIAECLGFGPVQGTEAVSALCSPPRVVQALAHALPFADASFDTVTMFDVMEHLLPEDTEAVCRELARVARQRVFLTIHNGPSSWRGADGDLHINRRESYDAWAEELGRYFAPYKVVNHGMGNSISAMFGVHLLM